MNPAAPTRTEASRPTATRVATPGLLTRLVQQVIDRRPDTRAITVRAQPRWDAEPFTVPGPDGHQVTVVVVACGSALAVRSALAEHAPTDAGHDVEADNGEGRSVLVVLVDMDEADLGADLLARFADGRTLSMNPWHAVRDLFGVRSLDAAFGNEDGWVADALLTHVPHAMARSLAGGGTLTTEVAYAALARVLLGADHLDIDPILTAAVRHGSFDALAAAGDDVRGNLLDAFAADHEPLGPLIAAILASPWRDDLAAVGVALRAVYGDGTREGGKAAGRVEAELGGIVIAPHAGATLAGRCEELITAATISDRERINEIIARADTLAEAWGAPSAVASPLLSAGFDARIEAAADRIGHILDGADGSSGGQSAAASGVATNGAAGPIAALERAVEAVEAHIAAAGPAGALRTTHSQMAARLAVWCTTPVAEPAGGFAESAEAYVADDAWVDLARRRLWRGDPNEAVNDQYRRLLDRVVARRRETNRRFAELLASWTTNPADAATLAPHRLVPLEDVLGTTVVPIAKGRPVVVVVLDGCALASFLELADQFSDAGFRELSPMSNDGGPAARRLSGIAVLPTVTEVSRMSLLAGALDRGDSARETAAFAANKRLRFDGTAAVLFHQAQLAGPAGASLAPEVERAVSHDGPRVVGAVINTIDDQLRKGDFTAGYRIGDLGGFAWLLEAARIHGRTVIVTADHGHVLAQPADGGAGNFQRGGDGGERWRNADRAAGDTEVVLHGPRVLLGGDDGVLAPWDDDFRYGAKAGGYHGGATPEEVLVPLAVFNPAGVEPPTGWQPGVAEPPEWWKLRVGPTTAGAAGDPVSASSSSVSSSSSSSPSSTRPRRGAKAADDTQPSLFAPTDPADSGAPTGPPDADTATGSGGPSAGAAWVDALLASDVWATQKKAAGGRPPMRTERVRAVLESLDAHGGVASFAVLAGESNIPQNRLSGFLAHLARILNVDGYGVLDVDVAAGEVRLSRAVLIQQFRLDQQ